VDRHMRSIAHQMKAARFPIHRDLADFEVSTVDKVDQEVGDPGLQSVRRKWS